MNSKKKCTGCGKRFTPDSMISFPAGVFHSIDCATTYAQNKIEQAKKRRIAKAKKDERLRRSEKRKAREAIKTISQLKKEAQASFNKYIRIRDYNLGCCSCCKSKQTVESEQGWKVGGCWDAGHFKTRGAKPQLRFNLFNVHKQCKPCNAGGGKFSAKAATVDEEYRIKLIEKIGEKRVIELENNNDIVKFDREYLIRIKKIFNKKYRLYKNLFRNID